MPRCSFFSPYTEPKHVSAHGTPSTLGHGQIAEQQDRFKTNAIVAGVNLDAEMVEASLPRPAGASTGNKYTNVMDRRKHQQQHKQAQ